MSHRVLGSQFALVLNQSTKNDQGRVVPSNEPHQVTGDDTDVLSKAQELLASSPDPRASVTHYLVEGRAPKAYHGLPYILHPDDVGLDLASSEEVGKYFDPRKA